MVSYVASAPLNPGELTELSSDAEALHCLKRYAQAPAEMFRD
ncbi:MAG: hypothetical protein NTZ03_09145 [Actinobacteria bacterium]|nr:hypothetical protein [Actinomycetota bacterium]